MMRWTAKLSSRWESFGLRRARFRASSLRQVSMVSRKASSTSAVPRLALAGFRKLVERAFEDGLLGKYGGDFMPARGVFRERDVKNAADGGAVGLDRA